jgi:hypothetical protein
MKFSLGTDPLDLFDGFLGLGEAGIGWPSLGPVVIPGVPALTSEAIEASAAQSGPASPVVETSGGITFNLLFDAAAMAAPASFRAGIEQAAALLGSVISDKITVNIKIDYSGTGGGAAAGADSGQYISYSALRTDLINAASPGDTTFSSLPSGSTFQGQTYVAVWNAQLKALGLLPANDTTTDDGSATFATDINPNLLVGVALHELTHALGRIPYGQPYGTEPDIFDMFRFTSAGTRLIDGTSTAPAAYFSLDGGVTKLGDYGQTSDSSDFLNSGVQGSTDPFDEFYSGNTVQHLTALDITQLDALGFHASAPDTQTPTLASDVTLKMLAGATQTITSSLLSATDNVSSGAQLHYAVTRAPADGTLLLNGVATTSFTQADLNNGLVSYHETAGGVRSDNFLFTVTDAAGNVTGTQTFQIGIDHAPVLTLASPNVSASAAQSLPACSLFSATDADGDTLSYYIYDATTAANSGHFVVNGTVVPAGNPYAVTAAQLAQTTFVAGAAGTSDDVYAIAFDGQAYSGNGILSEFHVNVANHAPVLTVPSANVSASAGQSFSASSLFSASDADGDTLSYYIYDATTAANSGHFVVNGTVVPAGNPYAVTAAQLAQTTFVAGAAGTSDDLYAIAFDGHAYSNNGILSEFHVNVAGPNHAPILTVPSSNVSASAGQSFSASSLFSASDADGDALSYYIYDATTVANSGHFMVNGTVVPAGNPYAVTAAQLAQTTFVAGAAGTSDDLYAIAFDGQAYSGNGVLSEFHVNVTGVNHAPMVTVPSANVAASAGQSLPVSSLFSATDADGDTLSYYLYEGSAANTGHFVVNGTVEPAQTSFLVTAAQLAQTTFVAGSAGTSADLYATAFDGRAYSGNGIASEFHVNVAVAGQAPAATSPVASAGAGQFFQSSLLAGDAFGHFSVHDIASALHDFHVLV